MAFSEYSRLPRPYNVQVLIEVYIRTKRRNFVHRDFEAYYAGLLETLERLFEIRLSREGLSFDQKVFWSLFENTVVSLLKISTPWDSYQEAGLIHKKLEASGETGKVVDRASQAIFKAAEASEAAHREILHALFVAIFGDSWRAISSEELRLAGFDDSREPEISDYYDYL